MPETFPFDVFLSHNSKDKPRVRRLAERLRAAGLRVWFDEWHIGPGDIIALKVDEGLERSRVLLLCVSPNALASGWVALERSTAIHRDPSNEGRHFIPLLLEDCELPATVRRYRYVDYRQEAEAAFAELLAVCRAVAGAGPGTPAPPRALSAGDVLEGELGMRLRYVPGGTYWIGSPEGEEGRTEDEVQHPVTISRGFWLGETPVTQGQWRYLVSANPSYFKAGDDHPVEQVSWWEAVAFANLVSERAGLEPCYELVGCKGTLGKEDFECERAEFRGFQCSGYRLPSEAEWEVAARAVAAGGQAPLASRPASEAELGAIAWYGANSEGTTHPVGTKRANAWGFKDMLGNVWEWTGDGYGAYPTGLVLDPLQREGTYRVIRGGSWLSHARFVRAAFRILWPPSLRDGDLGFRLARGQAAPG
jgi:formylglycine-generating enzyme required for sulfatase activity